MPDFCHLHCHTQFSLLDGASEIGAMMDKAKADGMRGVALTDHGNMFGAFKFVAEAQKRDLKPIVGCEFYLVEDRHRKEFSRAKGERDRRFHQLLLAKDKEGYKNLSKLCSLGFIEGMYSKFPRIDKEILETYHEGLIATSCCIGAEIPQAIIKGDLEDAEKKLRWWLDLFGEDFYIEIQRHRGLENIDGLGISQEDINQILLGFAKKYQIKVIATNDSHYIEEDDWDPHDILLCVNTGARRDLPPGYGKGKRFAFSSSDYYFKTQSEMNDLFYDVPAAIDHTMEIYDKITPFDLKRDILLPHFKLPVGFDTQADYLRYLSFQGAKASSRYGRITDEVRQRLDHELNIIRTMGFDGYFLIVQDFMNAAREMGVAVGPGRGSAAGSAVAFCLGITNIDPIKYNLLFERFLNPERISMPDIDIDFDDYGRQDVIDWVVDKYGKQQVAQIITFGTMAAKSSIRDVARVLDLPLPDSDRIAKLVPSKPGTKLAKLFGKSLSDLSSDWTGDDFGNIKTLHEIHEQPDLEGQTLRLARKLEGAVRNTGIHAAGVIIAPDDITEYIPVCTSKDADLLVTQFDGSVVEDAGMLKMDFLGLKTLSIIKDAIENIVGRFGEALRIDPDQIPLDDPKTYELFQRGDTVGIFQFESEGMQKNLAELKPTNIEDLIAMNALYRPGPMDYIPLFVARKHGREKVEYPHEWLKDILEPTYGIMVYQEQIMQTAQIMADYSLGQADMLRRAMGKKKMKEMERHSKIFTEGAVKKGVDKEKAEEIYEIMAKFASYGFNRSHAAAYSVVAFQTAYLKANYCAEYMASVLTHNKSDTTKLNFFLQECKLQGVEVLGPSVNESGMNFTVNAEGKIRFGLSALKGVGEGPVNAILSERKANGPFKSIFDLVERVNLRQVNKKCMESLVYGGAFDLFEDIDRAQYFGMADDKRTLIDALVFYGNAYKKQQEDNKTSLFGAVGKEIAIPHPKIPEVVPWSLIKQLDNEKQVTGIYISGHPLDDYAVEMKTLVSPIKDLEKYQDRTVALGGIVIEAQQRVSKKGKEFGKMVIEDFDGQMELLLFSENYQKFRHFFQEGQVLYLKGKYEKGWRGDFEFRPFEIRQLDAFGEEAIRGLRLKIPVERISEELIRDLKLAFSAHPGPHDVEMLIGDMELSLPLHSKAYSVTADSLLIAKLERMGLESKILRHKK